MVKITVKDLDAPKPNFTRPTLLLHPNIPKPLHGLNPRTIMGQRWWDHHRKEAFKKNNQCCWACGVSKYEAKYHQWLEGHESYKIDYYNGIMELEEIVGLCHSCHNFIHSGRLQKLFMSGKINEDKYNYIINRGNAILENNNLSDCIIEPNCIIAKWSDWKLVIERKNYYSKFKDINEWREYYG